MDFSFSFSFNFGGFAVTSIYSVYRRFIMGPGIGLGFFIVHVCYLLS